MIEFLLSVFGRLITVFQTLWGTVYWLLTTGFSALINFVSALLSPVSDYVYNMRGDLWWYKYVTRSKTDDIVYHNYNKVRYSSIESFRSIRDYRNNKQNPLTGFLGTFYPVIKNLISVGMSQLKHLTNTPLTLTNFLFTKGIQDLKDYVIDDKPGVQSITPHARGVVRVARHPIAGRLEGISFRQKEITHLTDVRMYGALNAVADNVGGVLDASSERSQRLRELVDARKAGIIEMTEKDSLIAISTMKDKLDELQDALDTRRRSVLNAFADDPEGFIYNVLEDNVLAFLVSLIIAGFYEEEKG